MRSKSILWSFDYAIQGVIYALRTQRNMRLHALMAVVVLLASLFFRITGLELIAIIISITLVVVAELVNTALEATVDLAVQTFDPMAKTAKDVAAGAVFLAAINAVAVGYIVFFGRLTPRAERLMQTVRESPSSITLVALVLTAVAVVVLKALTHEGTFMRGGWPSGHTALAVATATAIGYGTRSGEALIFAYFIAALVAQSRVETEAHTIPQTLLGAAIGLLLTTAVFQVFLR